MTKSERELRQYRLMDDRLRGFLAGTVRLGDEFSDLEGLLYALEETAEKWRRSFHKAWGTLEVFYALALAHGDPVLPDASVPCARPPNGCWPLWMEKSASTLADGIP